MDEPVWQAVRCQYPRCIRVERQAGLHLFILICTAVRYSAQTMIIYFAVDKTSDYQYSEIVYYNGRSWHSLPECRMRAVDFF